MKNISLNKFYPKWGGLAMFRKKQVIEALKGIKDISEPQLAYYLKRGIVIPDEANPSGSKGDIKYYGDENLLDIAIARELEENGLSLKAISGLMPSIRKEVRFIFRRLKDNYRLHLIIADPNKPGSWARLQMCLREDLQRGLDKKPLKNPVDPSKVTLDMDKAKTFLVVDLSELIKKMEHLF